MYLISVDQGTTSTRAILFDENLNILKISRRKFTQIYPKEGWVEHDPEEIWKTVVETVEEVMEGLKVSKIAALGITNQRETIVAWDSKTGEVLYNAIVWQCRRTAKRTEDLKRTHGDVIKRKTGLVVDPYFSASKMEWMIENVDSVRGALERGTLRFGTIDSFLAWRMTGKHVTDVSNASRTMLFNIEKLDWDDELLEIFHVPRWTLPKIVGSSEVVGETKWGFLLSGMTGDQQSALFGQLALETGETKVTMGTGSFILMNIGDTPKYSESGILTTIAWNLNGKTTYAFEGSVFITGALIDWFLSIGIFKDPQEISELAFKTDNGGVYIVPALTGLGAPYWDPYARGLMIGITRSTSRDNIARAILESIAFSIKELVELMEKEGGSIPVLKVDGGVSKSDVLLRIISKATGKRIERPSNLETTATGAVMLAGLSTSIFDIEKLKDLRRVELDIEEDKGLEEEFERWREAVRRSLNWAR